MTRNDKIYDLLYKMTVCQVPYGREIPDETLEMMKRNNPRAYGWLMMYRSLIEEEKKEKENEN
jgi:hypothetical protein